MSEQAAAPTAEQLEQAHQRLVAANGSWEQAKAELNAADAEATRLLVLEIASRHPGLTAVAWTIEWQAEKDVFFRTTYANAVVDEDAPGQQDAYDRHGEPGDELNDLNVDADTLERIAEALGPDADRDGEFDLEVTIEQLRGLSFPKQPADRAES
jgi:hypothetical protein